MAWDLAGDNGKLALLTNNDLMLRPTPEMLVELLHIMLLFSCLLCICHVYERDGLVLGAE